MATNRTFEFESLPYALTAWINDDESFIAARFDDAAENLADQVDLAMRGGL